MSDKTYSALATEVTDLLGLNRKEKPSSKAQPEKKHQAKAPPEKKHHIPSESELALAKSLSYDKEVEGEEIIPCCTYFCWGSYLACCTEDVAALKLLGVYVSKRKSQMEFESSRLYIIKIKATGIQSVEFIGKNDLFLDLFLGKWSSRTKVLTDCGADGDWNYGDSMIIDAASKTIATQGFNVKAYDKNKLLSDVFIGEGAVSLSSLLEVGFDKEKSFTFPLSDKSNKLTGSITATFVLRKRADV